MGEQPNSALQEMQQPSNHENQTAGFVLTEGGGECSLGTATTGGCLSKAFPSMSAIPALFIPCCSLVSRRGSSLPVCCGMMLHTEALCGTPVQRSSVINAANLPNSAPKLECSPVLDEHWKFKLEPKTFLR